MPKNKPTRRTRKTRRPAPKPVAAAQPTRVVAQPLAVASPGEAPVIAKQERAIPAAKRARNDYSYVRRDIQRMVILAAAVLVAIVVISFFLP